ncbi:MAG TPA: OsmC family peroxiredoxin [Ktedonobacterales bacterium]|nr:OsmC family peroxiredoxin [Ktedonobacterales bacterium]
MAAERQAEVIWQGNLTHGNGRLRVGSGAFGEQLITWAARTEQPEGMTSPEELIAAAHAGCYAMAFSSTLNKDGHPPEQLTVNAVCTLDGGKITTMKLDVEGKVPGLDEAAFQEAAKRAEQSCPVSNALRNNVQIELHAHLA